MNLRKYNFLKAIIKTLALIVVAHFTASGQTIKREYWIGDTVPDLELKNTINFKTKTSHLSDFTGKLVILDFWATWCTPCIAAMPKLDSIQKTFSDKIQIIPITYEDSNIVVKFINRMSKVLKVKPASVVNDNFLRFRFKHKTLPHYVWLDGNRKVIAVSEAKDVNVANISEYLKGNMFKFTVKHDTERALVGVPAFAPSIQILDGMDTVIERLSNDNLVIHTILTKYVEGLPSGGSFRDSTYFVVHNMSIANLYKIAIFGNQVLTAFNPSSIIVEISDPDLYMKVRGKSIDGTKLSSGLETLEWLKVNGYCYESKTPPELSKDRFNIMKDELNRYFGIKYGIFGEKKLVKREYLALVRISQADKIKSKGGEQFVRNDKFSFKMTNMKIGSFVNRMALPLQNFPSIIDETNYNGDIDLEINCDLSNLKAVNAELQKYDLRLEEKQKMLDTGIITIQVSHLKEGINIQ